MVGYRSHRLYLLHVELVYGVRCVLTLVLAKNDMDTLWPPLLDTDLIYLR